MAVDLALYVFADPLHAALILASAPGSGFDENHHADNVDFRFRSNGLHKEAMMKEAREEDEKMRPLLDDLQRRAIATLADLPEDLMVRDSNIPVSRLPSYKLKAMGLADRALVQAEATDDTYLSNIIAERHLNQAFVIDLTVHAFLLRYAARAGTDTAPLRRVLDAGLGRVATILSE